jgi:beta-lysine 5,6-aminomutase alpha subunit
MTKLYLNPETIAKSRKLAREIVDDLLPFIKSHTTVSVERANLRLLGIDGVDHLDTPYVNALVDHIHHQADLSKGILHYISYAMHDHNLTPQALAEKVSEKTLDLSRYQDEPVSPYLDLLAPYLNQTLDKIKAQARYRNNALKGVNPLDKALYVIVATGNIYEDIEQAKSAVQKGADIIAVIRTTGQSLLDYVPYGATTEGFGGTYATQENFRLMREALDIEGKRVNRYIKLVNYASGLCMPEIAAIGAMERLDMMLNDSLYGIIFRDINMKRTFIDQYFSRVLSALASITINTGEDNYLTTADAHTHAHTVLASQFINEQFALKAYMDESLIGLGHAYEIDPSIENSFSLELSQALMSKEIFPKSPLKYMPPTKHMTGNIFKGYMHNALFNIVATTTNQSIHLLGMLTEAIHTPFMSDRALAIDNAKMIDQAFKDFGNEIMFNPDGIIVKRASEVLNEAHTLLETIKDEGLFKTLEIGRFALVKRPIDGGKGQEGVIKKHADYQDYVFEALLKRLKEGNHVS